MNKKQTQHSNSLQPITSANDIQVYYANELDTNPKYSLSVDPADKYNFTENEKNIIKDYIEFKNIQLLSTKYNMQAKDILDIILSPCAQKEIKRIDVALKHHQFTSKLISIDQIGGYLSSLLTNENVPQCDQLSTSDKLRVVDMILKLHNIKSSVVDNPEIIANADIDTQLKSLSIKTLKSLIGQLDKHANASLVDKLNIDDILTDEEKQYLSSLSTSELLLLLNATNQKEENK